MFAALAPFPDDPEEEIIPYVGPPKLLPVVLKTGEEDEVCLASFKCKIYRYKDDEWKQRGQGILKFLKHNETKKCRLLMRQDATFFIRANHIITSEIHKSMFHQYGYEWEGTESQDTTNYCVKLESNEDFDQFIGIYEECRIQNINED